MSTIWVMFVFVYGGCFSSFAQSLDSSAHFSASILTDTSLCVAHLAKTISSDNMHDVDIQYFIIKTSDNTYGYSIFLDGDLFIEQKTIPGRSGSKGLVDVAKAEKLAKLVIFKLRAGQSLPTISEQEVSEIVGSNIF